MRLQLTFGRTILRCVPSRLKTTVIGIGSFRLILSVAVFSLSKSHYSVVTHGDDVSLCQFTNRETITGRLFLLVVVVVTLGDAIISIGILTAFTRRLAAVYIYTTISFCLLDSCVHKHALFF